MKSVLNVLIGLLAGFILAAALFLVSRLPAGKPVTLEPSPTKVPIEVQVTGAVVHPGLYAFPDDSRVQDAITAAGGLLAEADSGSVNLAAKLTDGQQLNIPGGSSGSTGSSAGTSPGTSSGTGSGSPFTVIPTAGSSITACADLVNINTASLTELESLPGIGPTIAQKIIDYRAPTQHGPFANIQDILNVSGIGPTTFDEFKDKITVGCQ
jgi:competence protein ComEA